MPKTDPVATFLILNHRGGPTFFRKDAQSQETIEFRNSNIGPIKIVGEVSLSEFDDPLKKVAAPKEQGHYCFSVQRTNCSDKPDYFIMSVVEVDGEKDPCFTVKERGKTKHPLVSVAAVVKNRLEDLLDVMIDNQTGGKLEITERSPVRPDGKSHSIVLGQQLIEIKRPKQGQIVSLSIDNEDEAGGNDYRIAQTGGTDQADIIFP